MTASPFMSPMIAAKKSASYALRFLLGKPLKLTFRQRRNEQHAFGLATTSVVYCHTDSGCKFAITKLQSTNGIVDAKNGTIYVANAVGGGVYVLERQTDNSLVLSEYIKTGKRPNCLFFPCTDSTKRSLPRQSCSRRKWRHLGCGSVNPVLERLFV